MSMKKPNLSIVGQPRSGTTALYRSLKQHPDVFLSDIKEPNYFSKDLRSFHFERRKLARTDENYLKLLFGNCRDERAIGEGSTDYLYSTVAAKEIHQFSPSAKIIMIFREPVEFLRSYHAYRLRSFFEQENIQDFVEALQSESARRQGNNIPQRCLNPPMLYYSERVKYSEQISRYYNTFDKEQIKTIVYDDFKNDNAKVYRDVLVFLGVNPDFTPVFTIANSHAAVRFGALKIGMDEDYLKIRRVLKPRLPRRVFQALKYLYDAVMLNTAPRPPLDPSLQNTLRGKYKEELERVSRLLNRDLVKFWGYE